MYCADVVGVMSNEEIVIGINGSISPVTPSIVTPRLIFAACMLPSMELVTADTFIRLYPSTPAGGVIACADVVGVTL